MSFLSRLLNLSTFGISGTIAGVGGGKKTKTPTMNDQLAPYLQQYSDIAKQYSNQAGADYNVADKNLNDVLGYYHNILNGSREDLLKTVDASGLTAATDEQERQNYELASRGGRRAATGANLEFDKLAILNKYLQSLRGEASGQITNIAQLFANMGQGKLSAAMGGTAGASNLLFGEEQIKQQIADRKAALISSIFEAIGGAAGMAIGCNTLDTWILTLKHGYIQLEDIRIGDKVYTLVNEKLEEAKVIRKDTLKNQNIYELNCNDSLLKGSLSHVLTGVDNSEVIFEDILTEVALIPLYKNDEFITTSVKSFKQLNEKEDVAILKLNNEKDNYNYITNGFISIDADCKE
jgi:hypothetical protein